MNLWAMPTEIYSQALRAWGILCGGGVWESGCRIRTAFGLNYSQALWACWLRPVSLRSPQGFTFLTFGRSPEGKGNPERAILCFIPKPAGLHLQYLRAQLGGGANRQKFQDASYSTGSLYTYLYFTFCSITNITGTIMSVRKNEKTTP